jgi:hypothetical protein
MPVKTPPPPDEPGDMRLVVRARRTELTAMLDRIEAIIEELRYAPEPYYQPTVDLLNSLKHTLIQLEMQISDAVDFRLKKIVARNKVEAAREAREKAARDKAWEQQV